MSVILAATSLANQNGNFSPQHTNNWSVEIYGIQGGALSGSDPVTFSLARGFLPQVGIDETVIPFGNEQVYAAGRARYEGGSLEIRDYVDVDIQGLIAQWFSMVYGGVVGNWGVIGQPAAYKRLADLLLSAPDGTVTRSWRLQGVWPTQWNPGALDMASSEQLISSLSLRFDRAQYMGGSANLTSAVPGALTNVGGGVLSGV